MEETYLEFIDTRSWDTDIRLEEIFFFEDCFEIMIGIYPCFFDLHFAPLEIPERAVSLHE